MSEKYNSARDLLNRFSHDTSGTTAIEYAVIAAGIAMAIVASVTGVGTEVNTLFQSIKGNF